MIYCLRSETFGRKSYQEWLLWAEVRGVEEGLGVKVWVMAEREVAVVVAVVALVLSVPEAD